jgi:hypothetical protein
MTKSLLLLGIALLLFVAWAEISLIAQKLHQKSSAQYQSMVPPADMPPDRQFVEYLQNAQEKCIKQTSRTKYFACFKEEIKPHVVKYGIKSFITNLHAILETDTPLTFSNGRNCHDITHAIGQTGGVYMSSIVDAALSCTSLCGNGCHHGVMEGRLSLGDDMLELVPNFCDYSQDSQFSTAASHFCYHGLGHGIATILANEKKSLQMCDKAQEEGRKDCARGVFMELYNSDPSYSAHLPVPNDIAAWCSSLKGAYGEVCWELAGSNVNMGDAESNKTKAQLVDEAFSTCGKAPGEKNKEACINMLGHNLFNEFQSSLSSLKSICKKAGSYYETCVLGIVHGNIEADPAGVFSEELCNTQQGAFKEECLQVRENQIKGSGFRASME